MLEKKFIDEFKEKYGRSPWQCKYCDTTMRDNNKGHHLKTEKHKLKKQIYKLNKKI